VIVEPPSPGASQETTTVSPTAIASMLVGAHGTVAGVTELDAPDAALFPTLFVATTVNV
jgi:hypothetical protein